MDVITAAEMLHAGGMDVDRVRHHLARVDPAKAKVRVAPGWFMSFWARGVVGVCMPWAIYVRPEVMQRYRNGDGLVSIATLIAHELTHLEQYRRLGPIRHGIRYAADYIIGRFRRLGHWDAYRAIGLEREARYVAALITAESQA
jgi:hypothetical protein